MKFLIDRTSRYTEKPCEEAVPTKEGLPQGLQCNAWEIEISSIEDLRDFVKKYGDIVISESLFEDDRLEIEIYDQPRES